MIVGTPGTGIGGLFYLLLAAWMPVHQAWRALGGRAIPGAWKVVVSSLAQGGAMIGALCGEAWLIKTYLGPMLAKAVSNIPILASVAKPMSDQTGQSILALAPALAVAPLAALTLVLLAVHVARLLGLSRRGRAPQSEADSMAHAAPAPAAQLLSLTPPDRRADISMAGK